MEGPSNTIQQRLVKRVRENADKWLNAFELKRRNPETPPEIANELEATAEKLKQDTEHFLDAVKDPFNLSLQRVLDLLELLPPDRTHVRYDLDRLTRTYDEICMDVTEKAAEFFAQGEAAIDREDYDIGINVLKHTQKMAPRFFPATLVLGYAYLMMGDTKEAQQCFDRGLGFLPPEHAEHYRTLLIELIIKVHETDQNYANALRAYRRLQGLGMDNDAINYAMARNLVLNGQKQDAMHIIQNIFPDSPELFSYAIVDSGFANVEEELVAILNDTRSEWTTSVEEVLNKLEKINQIVVFYGLNEQSSELQRFRERIHALRESLNKTSNAEMQAIMSKTIPEIVPGYPNLIEEMLEEMSQERREEISRYNKELLEKAEEKQRRATVISIAVWVVVTISLFLSLLLSNTSFLVALVIVISTMPFGFVPVAAVGRGIRNRIANEYISASPIRQIKADANDVHWTKSDILGRISKEGWT